jgi:hypothetical protein
MRGSLAEAFRQSLLQNVDPQMPPESLLPPGAARFAEEVSLPFETESEIRREFARNLSVSREIENSSISSTYTWLRASDSNFDAHHDAIRFLIERLDLVA